MILGVGTDICDVRRIAAALKRFDQRFRARVFTEAEIALAGSQSNESLFYAKRVAAKEAGSKALSATPVRGLGWHDAEILKIASGAPILTLSNLKNLKFYTMDATNSTIKEWIMSIVAIKSDG